MADSKNAPPHLRLTPDPRPAADAETRLQGLVLLPVLDSCPDEHGNDTEVRKTKTPRIIAAVMFI